jgi:hypothetical protein
MVGADVIAGLLRAGAGVVLTIALFGCESHRVVTREAAQGPLSVDLQFDPMPARVGSEGVTVYVRDHRVVPVTGAVVDILPSYATVPGGHAMPMPGMGRVAKTVRATDAGDGVYHARVELTKATHWTFVVDVGGAGPRTTVTQDLEVR